MSRAPRREKLFNQPEDKDQFIDLIKAMCKKYKIVLYAYCLMDNHYHLFMMTQNPNLSKAMHFLHCSYGSWFRSKYRLPGAIFQGRFKAIIVDIDSYAIQLATYIHLNPFRCGLEKKLGKYLWNSLPLYIKRKKVPEYLDQSLVFDHFGKTKGKSSKKYLEHTLENTNMKNPILNPKFGIAVGSESFLEEIEVKIKELEFDDEIPSMKMTNRIQPEEIIKQIADHLNVSKTIIRFEEECRDDIRLLKLCEEVKNYVEIQNRI